MHGQLQHALPDVAVVSMAAVVSAAAAADVLLSGSVWRICDDSLRFLLLLEEPPPVPPVNVLRDDR
jgi:hypothetical protein